MNVHVTRILKGIKKRKHTDSYRENIHFDSRMKIRKVIKLNSMFVLKIVTVLFI